MAARRKMSAGCDIRAIERFPDVGGSEAQMGTGGDALEPRTHGGATEEES